MKLEGVEDRDEALRFKGAFIKADSSSFPDLEPGEYYWSQIIGLKVTTTANGAVGTVIDMMATGANDVLIVSNGKQHLIPYTAEVVVETDIESGTMLVDWDVNY